MFELTVQREKVRTNSVTSVVQFHVGSFTGCHAISTKFFGPLLSIIDDYSIKGERPSEETTPWREQTQAY